MLTPLSISGNSLSKSGLCIGVSDPTSILPSKFIGSTIPSKSMVHNTWPYFDEIICNSLTVPSQPVTMIMLPVSSWSEYFSMHAAESTDCKSPTDVLPLDHERVTETPLMNWASTRIILVGRSPVFWQNVGRIFGITSGHQDLIQRICVLCSKWYLHRWHLRCLALQNWGHTQCRVILGTTTWWNRQMFLEDFAVHNNFTKFLISCAPEV